MGISKRVTPRKSKRTRQAQQERPFVWFFDGAGLSRSPLSPTEQLCYRDFLKDNPDMATYGGADVMCSCQECVRKFRCVAEVLGGKKAKS